MGDEGGKLAKVGCTRRSQTYLQCHGESWRLVGTHPEQFGSDAETYISSLSSTPEE
jgi:hypothetical protein